MQLELSHALTTASAMATVAAAVATASPGQQLLLWLQIKEKEGSSYGFGEDWLALDQPTTADKEKGEEEEEEVGEQEQLRGALLRGVEGEWVAALKLGQTWSGGW